MRAGRGHDICLIEQTRDADWCVEIGQVTVSDSRGRLVSADVCAIAEAKTPVEHRHLSGMARRNGTAQVGCRVLNEEAEEV